MNLRRICDAVVFISLTVMGTASAGALNDPSPSGISQPRLPSPSHVAGFVGYIQKVALGVEDSGTIHILWSGQRSGDATFLAFYSSSNDNGTTWTPLQILDSNGTFHVALAVDQAGDLVHMIYNSTGHGLYHRTVSGGVVSPPTQVDDGFSLTPRLTVNPTTGTAYLLWDEWTDDTFTELSTYISSWNGMTWGAPFIPYGGPGTLWQSVAVSPSGAVMVGGLSGNRARSSLATDGTNFAFPVSVPGTYPGFEEDDTASVGYGHEFGTFHMLTDHFLWPGSSDIFHRVWDGAAWSNPDNISESSDTNSPSREAFHSSPAVPCTMASWMENDLTTIFVRQVANPTPGDPVDLGQAFTSQGLFINFNSRHSVALTSDGALHMALGESRYLEEGLWYQSFEPLCIQVLFADGFESGFTDAWSSVVDTP